MIEPMKAITLWQPWASLLSCGAKKYETRSLATKYRGPIAIHAAARHPNWWKRDTYSDAALEDALVQLWGAWGWDSYDALPRGCIIATAELVGCWKMTDDGHTVGGARAVRIENVASGAMPDGAKTNIIQGSELLFGDWMPGRYAWELANVKLLDNPIPAKGRQGLWNWEGAA